MPFPGLEPTDPMMDFVFFSDFSLAVHAVLFALSSFVALIIIAVIVF